MHHLQNLVSSCLSRRRKPKLANLIVLNMVATECFGNFVGGQNFEKHPQNHLAIKVTSVWEF
jgi:hypothetical protein